MADVQVTYADQQQINTFNKLNQKYRELSAQVKAKKELLENLEDATNELVLVDEDKVKIVVGECFFHADPEEAEEHIELAQDSTKTDLQDLDKSITVLKRQMAELKQTLYGKFGDSINLEDD